MENETRRIISRSDLAGLGDGHVAYIREIAPEKALALLGNEVELPSGSKLFCLYMADGTPFAISASFEAAMANAFEHDLLPMSVH
jgi:hypothetical protein